MLKLKQTDPVPPNYTGMVKKPDWTSLYVKGRLHCVDGPARVWWDDLENWYFKGKRHRTDGAAVGNQPAYSEDYWYILDECIMSTKTVMLISF